MDLKYRDLYLSLAVKYVHTHAKCEYECAHTHIRAPTIICAGTHTLTYIYILYFGYLKKQNTDCMNMLMDVTEF